MSIESLIFGRVVKGWGTATERDGEELDSAGSDLIWGVFFPFLDWSFVSLR